MKPLLVLTLELVVEDDAIDTGAARVKALGLAFVRAIDLDVVLQFPSAPETGVEGLAAVLVQVTMALQKAATFLGQEHRVFARARGTNSVDEALFAQMAQVA